MLRQFSVFLGGLMTGLLATGLLLLLTRPRPRYPIELIPPPTAGPINVHVAGAVRQPGVVQLEPGSIVEQAIAAAGGPSEQADLSRLNLAQTLQPGQQIYIPALASTQTIDDSAPASTPSADDRINVNTADEAQLEGLPGIGPSLATSIVEYREQHGWFQEVDELIQVPGIGPAKLDQIRDLIAFH